MAVEAPGTRIRGFDGLRAIAFVLVFLSHKIKFADANPYGGVGVWVFFVLSGFLITRILAGMRSDMESERATLGQSLRRFYVRRTARIFPPYYLLLAVIAVVSLFVPIDAFWGTEKIAYATYTTNIMIAERGFWPGHFGHLWTLAVEEQFYLLFAPLVLLVPRRHTLALCLAVLALGVATNVEMEIAGATTTAKDVGSLVNFSLLALGGAAGLSAHRKLPPWLLTGSAQLAVLALLVVQVPLFAHLESWHLYGRMGSAVAAGLLLLQIVQAQGSWFVNVLNLAPLRDLGRVSYGAYLVHNFIYLTPFFLGADEPLGFGLPWIAVSLLEFAITIAIVALSWRYLEKPIMAWAAKVTAREPVPVEAARPRALQPEA